jgi:hypothetical protein
MCMHIQQDGAPPHLSDAVGTMIITFLINGSVMVITTLAILITRPQPPRVLFVRGT